MPRIFISYRRDDTLSQAARLYTDLSDRFGEDQLFMDLNTIQPGVKFRQSIEDAIEAADFLIALIGRQWLSIVDDIGNRRLDNPGDFVRMEIAAALRRDDVTVIPVLVQDAPMPDPRSLPADLAGLADWQAHELSDRRWRADLEPVLTAITMLDQRAKVRAPEPGLPAPPPAQVGTAPGQPEQVGNTGAAQQQAWNPAGNDPAAPADPGSSNQRRRLQLGVLGTAALLIVVLASYFQLKPPVPGPTEAAPANASPTQLAIATPTVRPATSTPSPPTPTVQPTASPTTAVAPAVAPTNAPRPESVAKCPPSTDSIRLPTTGETIPVGRVESPKHESKRQSTAGIVVHATRSGAGDDDLEAEYDRIVDLMLLPSSPISANAVVGPLGLVCQFFDDELEAWHANVLDPTHLGIFLAQPREGVPFTDFQIEAAAAIVRRWCDKYSIPMVRVTSDQERGIIGSQDTAHGKSIGITHPGTLFPWDRFITLVGQAPP